MASVIADFAAKQKAFNERVSTGLADVGIAVEDIAKDIETLNKKIEDLQNSPGGVTPEDQALLDELESVGGDLATKVETASTALKDLAAKTPPPPPVEPVP